MNRNSVESGFNFAKRTAFSAAAAFALASSPVLAESGIPVDNGSVSVCQEGSTAYVMSLGYDHYAKMLYNSDCTLRQDTPFVLMIICENNTTMIYAENGRLQSSHTHQVCTTPMLSQPTQYYPAPSEPIPEPQPEFPA